MIQDQSVSTDQSNAECRSRSNQSTYKTTWSLVIPTFKRAHILPRCLMLAAFQTRPPAEIIIVDASPDWEDARNKILSEVACKTKGISWVYVQAERASSAAQRNQGIRLSTSDVVVFIDDDCLMYPDCAEAMMEVFDLDFQNRIAGVGATFVVPPPDEPQVATEQTQASRGSLARSLRDIVRKFLKADDIFVPYDRDFPNQSLPKELEGVPLARSATLAGGSSSFRRSLLLKERFEEILERYASGEDSDVSYRISRHGTLVIALKGKIHHIGIGGGRLSTSVVTAFGAMNPAVLIRIYSTEPKERYTVRYRRLLYRRLVIQFLKDCSLRDWSIPRARGIWHAIRMLREIFSRDESALRRWYPQLQMEMIARDERKKRS